MNLEMDSSPLTTWEGSAAETLIADYWDPKQRTQLSQVQTLDPQKLRENKCVLI